MNKFNIYEFLQTRPLSWSAISSFEYEPEQWYNRYILAIEEQPSPEMIFGKFVGDKLTQAPDFMPAIPRLKIFEHELRYTLLAKTKTPIPMIGFMDAHTPKYLMDEYKTGKKPWDQDRADSHGQIDMYLLMHYLLTKIPPEKMKVRIFWMPTKQNGDFSISFVGENNVLPFETKRTMQQVLAFGQRIQKTVKDMENYVNMRV